MNKFLILFLFFLVSCSSIPNRPDDLANQQLSFSLPKVESWKMSNGIEVYYYRDDELPIVQGKMYFRGGSVLGYSGIPGLADAVGAQMRSGGVEGIEPEFLDKELDSLAASVESDFDQEFGSVAFYTLKEDFNRVFELFSKVIKTPSFNKSKLELWKSLAKEGISSRKDKPNTMATMAFAEIIYGKDSPYSVNVSEKSLNKITTEALRKFYSKFVNPNNAYLSISGSISREELQKALELNFSKWNKPEIKLPEFPKVEHKIKPGIYVLEKDFDQAVVLIGHRGPARHTKDQYAIKIFNEAFGGSNFGSALSKTIRNDMGLAYYVYGGLASAAVEGVFQVQLASRADQVSKSVNAALDIINKVRVEVPTEFDSAKSSTEKSFVFKFDDQDFIPERKLLLKLYGFDADYDDRYLSNINNVSKEEVKDVAIRWINPDEISVVIVGKVSYEALKKEFAGKYNVYRLDFDVEPKFLE